MGVGRAAALVALTDADPTNLHIALLARARAGGGGLPVVMRAESAELSAYVNEHKDAVAVSSIAVTADVFAERALSAARSGKQGGERRDVA